MAAATSLRQQVIFIERPGAASAALSNVETPGGTTFEAVEIELPQLLKGEDILSALDRLRRRGRELRADLHRIASAPFPSSHAKKRARDQIEQLAQRGAVGVSLLVELDGDIEWPTLQVQARSTTSAAARLRIIRRSISLGWSRFWPRKP
jgi:hypothetical protein